MKEQMYYEDVGLNMEIPTLLKRPTTRQMVKWAAATNDFVEIHYDKDVARKAGLPDVLVHGSFSVASLVQMVMDWMGPRGVIRKLSMNWRGMHFPDQDLICKGKISEKYEKDKEHFITCEVWTENEKGKKCTIGIATIKLPTHGSIQ